MLSRPGVTLGGMMTLAGLAAGAAIAADAVAFIQATQIVPLAVSDQGDAAPAGTLSSTFSTRTTTATAQRAGPSIVMAISGEANASYAVTVSRPGSGADDACALNVSTVGVLSSQGQGSVGIDGLDQDCSDPVEFTIY